MDNRTILKSLETENLFGIKYKVDFSDNVNMFLTNEVEHDSDYHHSSNFITNFWCMLSDIDYFKKMDDLEKQKYKKEIDDIYKDGFEFIKKYKYNFNNFDGKNETIEDFYDLYSYLTDRFNDIIIIDSEDSFNKFVKRNVIEDNKLYIVYPIINNIRTLEFCNFLIHIDDSNSQFFIRTYKTDVFQFNRDLIPNINFYTYNIETNGISGIDTHVNFVQKCLEYKEGV